MTSPPAAATPHLAAQVRHVVQAATLAPSVHNTQPWRFVQRPDGFDLHADPARRLPVLDPTGRQLHLSCGAALLTARVAARALGLDAEVELLPDPEQSDLLARLALVVGAPADDVELALALAVLARRTVRDAFEPRPLPGALHAELRRAVEAEGAAIRQVVTTDDRIELAVLLSAADADAAETADPEVVVLTTAGDGPRSWLAAGQALGALLLHAAAAGVQAEPFGQVTDLPGTRVRLASALGLVGTPQLVLRLGYASATACTPRRTVDDVLV